MLTLLGSASISVSRLSALPSITILLFKTTHCRFSTNTSEFLNTILPFTFFNSQELCGAFRPGHFRGVATVVLKLFNIVQPQVAVFGKKDYQQLHVVKLMVEQLNVPVNIIGAETMRASDGLALSSRNQYLNTVERTEATFLYLMLTEIQQALKNGAKNHVQLEEKAVNKLVSHGWQLDYVVIRSQTSLLAAVEGERELVILVAAKLGKTRLIDNIEVCL